MKKIIITCAGILLSLCASAQVSVQVGGGYSSLNHAVVELGVQYDFNAAFIQAGYLAHASRDIDAPTMLNVRAGHTIYIGERYFAQPSVGYSWDLRSTDHKELNTQGLIYSLYAGKYINGNALLLGANYRHGIVVGCLTIRYIFN